MMHQARVQGPIDHLVPLIVTDEMVTTGTEEMIAIGTEEMIAGRFSAETC